MDKKKRDACAIAAHKHIREAGYGRDVWMKDDYGRSIVESHFGRGNFSLVEQVIIMENVSKAGKCKHITGNTSSVKGGKNRNRSKFKNPPLPEEVREVFEKAVIKQKSARATWYRTGSFDDMCEKLPGYHRGQIISWFTTYAKDYFKDKEKGLVYFARDPMRPDEYNIGYTERTAVKRFEDAGSKGRHWAIEAELKSVPESEVHNLLKAYKDDNGRGAETFILDSDARKKIKENYGIDLP